MSQQRRMRLLAVLVLALAMPQLAAATQLQELRSGIYWNPAESGWGLFVTDQGSMLAPVWFTNDGDGEPTWFLAPSVPDAEGIFRGEILRFTGVPLAQIAGQAADPHTVLGTAAFEFTGEGALQFTTRIDGVERSNTLQPLVFGDRALACAASSGSRAAASNYSDLWWSPESSGWGAHVAHVDESLYLTWYTYDSDREAVYLSGATTRQADGHFAGTLFRSRDGIPWTQIAGAPAASGTDPVGTLQVRFEDGENALFEYTIGNVTQTRRIQRMVFGDTPGLCTVQAAGGGDNAQGTECLPPYRLDDRHALRVTTVDRGQSMVSLIDLHVARQEAFHGVQALVEEARSDGVLTGRSYVSLEEGDTVASYGADGLQDGVVVASSVNDPLRLELTRFFEPGQTVQIGGRVQTVSQGQHVTSELNERWTLRAVEPMDTPAGRIEVCRFDYESDVVSAGARVSFRGRRFTSPRWGLVGKDGTLTTRVAGFDITATVREELLSASTGGQAIP